MPNLTMGLLYLFSILVPFAGVVVGIILLFHRNSEHRFVGRMCVAFGLVVLTIFILLFTIASLPDLRH